MEKGAEFSQPTEKVSELNPNVSVLLNQALNTAIGEFSRSYQGPENKSWNRYMNNLDTLCTSVEDPEDEDFQGNRFVVREQRLDKESDVFYIKLAPFNKIDTNRRTNHGSPTLDLSGGPVDECQIAIRPYCSYKGSNPEPLRTMSQMGYDIDFSVRNFSLLRDGKVSISDRLAGIGIKIALDGSVKAYLKTYIATEDFIYNRPPVDSEDNPNTQEVIKYLSTLGLSAPITKLKTGPALQH